jgi:hypothetical protein
LAIAVAARGFSIAGTTAHRSAAIPVTTLVISPAANGGFPARDVAAAAVAVAAVVDRADAQALVRQHG